MRTGRPNTLGERKDRPQGDGRVRAAAANAVNPSAAEEPKTFYMLQHNTFPGWDCVFT